MKFTSERERILEPLQAVIGVVERRQTMPILANVLLSAKNGRIAVTATDLEVELMAGGEVTVQQAGDITIPGRKLLDIVRALPDKAGVTFSLEGEKALVRAGKSRFTLTTLPASEFPSIEEINPQLRFQVEQAALKRLIDKTHFSMAQQDVPKVSGHTEFERAQLATGSTTLLSSSMAKSRLLSCTLCFSSFGT